MQDNQREEAIYFAGLFDGEGTICIQKDDREIRGKYKKHSPVYTVTLRIGMIDREIIQSFYTFMKVGYFDCEKKYHQFRPMYRWSVRAKEQVKISLKKLMPFLRLKKPQALLAMRFYEEAPTQRYTPTPEDIIAKKESFYLEMKRLNGVDINASPAETKRAGRSKSIRIASDSPIS